MVISIQEDIKNVICALKVIIIEIDSGIFYNCGANNYYWGYIKRKQTH